MAYPTLDATKEALDTLRTRIVFILARLLIDPNGAPFCAGFQSARTSWTTVHAKELALEDAIVSARAGVIFADRALDAFVEKVKLAIHKGRKVDVELPLHQLYFGALAPSIFEKPILGAELKACLAWPELLANAIQPELKALADEGAAVVDAARKAERALAQATGERDAFRKGGERAALFAEFNALCGTTHGALAALVHSRPELALDKGYADSFFQHSAAASVAPTTSAEAALVLAKLSTELAETQSLHDRLLAQESQRAEEQKAFLAAEALVAEKKQAAENAAKAVKDAEAAARKLRPKS